VTKRPHVSLACIRRACIRRACIAALLVAACTPTTPTSPQNVPATPAGDAAGAPVVRRPMPQTSSQAAPASAGSSTAPAAQSAAPPVTVPPGLLYVCVTEAGGTRKQVGIEYAPKVHDLCSRHPEMGPCQYERDACRSAGGRVFARTGEEITLAIEAEYDKKVRRVRFRAN
jgi:hypothetical protein